MKPKGLIDGIDFVIFTYSIIVESEWFIYCFETLFIRYTFIEERGSWRPH